MNLLSKDVERIYTSWNVTVRNVFGLDCKTHRSLIEPLSGCLHLKAMLLSRFVNFHHKLIQSQKFCVRFIARLQEKDLRTSSGRTLNYLLRECKIDDIVKLTSKKVKSSVRYAPIDSESEWSSILANELHATMKGKKEVEGFMKQELETLFEYICTN